MRTLTTWSPPCNLEAAVAVGAPRARDVGRARGGRLRRSLVLGLSVLVGVVLAGILALVGLAGLVVLVHHVSAPPAGYGG